MFLNENLETSKFKKHLLYVSALSPNASDAGNDIHKKNAVFEREGIPLKRKPCFLLEDSYEGA